MDVRAPLAPEVCFHDHADSALCFSLANFGVVFGLGLGSGELGSHLLLRKDEVAPWPRRDREGGQRA